MNARFKVYDEVWVMRGEKPTKLLVFAVVESMNYWKNDTDFHYRLVSSRIDAGWGNNEGEVFNPENCYATREELISSLQ